MVNIARPVLLEGPGHEQLAVGGGGQRAAEARGVPVETPDEIRRRREGARSHRLHGRVVEIELRGFERHRAPRQQVHGVDGELAERHRLRVRLPLAAAVRHAREQPACHAHLVIQFRQQALGDGHGESPGQNLSPDAP
jgi:hypothetical protein